MTWAENVKDIMDKFEHQKEAVTMCDFCEKSMYLIEADDEKMEFSVEIKIEKWMENPRGELHGGVCATFFDTATGIAAIAAVRVKKENDIADKNDVATVDLYTNYVARMPKDQTLVVTTRVLKNGRQFIRFECEARSKESGKLIATCMANYVAL